MVHAHKPIFELLIQGYDLKTGVYSNIVLDGGIAPAEALRQAATATASQPNASDLDVAVEPGDEQHDNG